MKLVVRLIRTSIDPCRENRQPACDAEPEPRPGEGEAGEAPSAEGESAESGAAEDSAEG